jgi:hypothetical protein
MWDFNIGKGDYGNAAWRFPQPYNFLSENNVSYWYNSKFINTGFKLGKDTKEGKFLTGLLQEKAPADTVVLYLDSLIFKYADSEALIKLIKAALDQAFQVGMRAKAKEIREVLYMD